MFAISVVICTKDRLDYLPACLDSILFQVVKPAEIIIVDSGNAEETRKLVEPFTDKISMKFIPVQANLTRARNLGVEDSAGDLVTFLDDDVVLEKEYLKEIRGIFENDLENTVGGVTGEILPKEQGRGIAHTLRGLPKRIFDRIFLQYRYGSGKIQASGHATLIRPGSSVSPVFGIEYLCGANMTFRRDVLQEFRFDEANAYREDDDIGYRVSRKYRNVYVPSAKLRHYQALAGGYGQRDLRVKREIEGYNYFFRKNFPQDFKHRLAFWWAMLGWFIMEAKTAVSRRDISRVKGFIQGVRSIKGRQAQLAGTSS